MYAQLPLRRTDEAFVSNPRDVPDGIYIDNPNGEILPKQSFGRIRAYRDGTLQAMYARSLTGCWRDCLHRHFLSESDLPAYIREALTKARS